MIAMPAASIGRIYKEHNVKTVIIFAGRLLIAAFLSTLCGVASAQQGYPNKPIRIIVPFPAGGGPSILAHLFGGKLTQSWGQQILVDNRPGGSTLIGIQALMKSAPDGYTLLFMTGAHVIYPLLTPNLPYHPIRDFTQIATLAGAQLMLVASPSVPANNLQELISLAKSQPGKVNYASVGTGGLTHLATESFAMLAGIQLQQIPYKGTAQALPDLVGGQVQMFFSPPTDSLIPIIKSGKLKVFAVTGDSRSPALPAVPTFREGGLADYEFSAWYGVMGPEGMARPLVDKLAAEFSRHVAAPDVRAQLVKMNMVPFFSGSEQMTTLLRTETEKIAAIIKAAGIKPAP